MKCFEYWATCLLGCSLLLMSCGGKQITCEGFTPSASATLAMRDMEACLKEVPHAGDWKYVLSLDKEMTDGKFGYTVGEGRVTFHGGDEIGVTHAVYTLLEDLGYTFDITGISAPGENKKEVGQLKDTFITPTARYRGIRQHVNFPMDISSYPIEEAKGYVEELLRMRFNKLTVHSYPGQWYETHIGDSLALAGNFFYGDVHYMYGSEQLKKYVPENDSIFCIPVAEKIFRDLPARSRFAVSWMQELINYAKDLGFYVQLSFEPRISTVEQAVATAQDIRNTYPRVDALEMITEETGGWGPGCTEEEVKQTLQSYFSPEIAADTVVTKPIRPRQSDLNALYTQIGIISKAIASLQEKGDFGPELKLGIYSTVTPYTEGAYRLARLAVPNTPVCLMASHGSDGTADAVSSLIRTTEDMRMAELYSWIEFDGLMYLYQNSIRGNEQLMKHIAQVLPGEQLGSLTYNHWRTAENRTSARYAAESTLDGGRSAEVFYQGYADRLQVSDVQTFKRIQELVNEGDSFARVYLGNIGFCWMGAWRSGGSYTWMKKENILTARASYMKAGELLSELITKTDKQSAAYPYLSFMGNRILCSVIYLDAFAEAVEIQTIRKEADGSISESERLRAQEICNRALLLFDQYMETHARMMPDRGCQGTLVSVWNAPIHGLKVYRSRLGGIALEELPHSDKPVDAPPLPIFYEGL